MKTLSQFLEEIDPSRTYDDLSARAQKALNALPRKPTLLEDWDEWQAHMTEVYCRVECALLGIRPAREPDPEFDWSRCAGLLDLMYGRNGFKAAFEMSRTGTEGGLRAVREAVAERMAETMAERGTAALVAEFLSQFSESPDRYLDAVREYLDKWGHLLPAEVVEKGAPRVASSFSSVLEKHPQALRSLRRVGR